MQRFASVVISNNRRYSFYRLVPSRYLSVFGGDRRLGIRLRRTRGLMGREEGKIATPDPPKPGKSALGTRLAFSNNKKMVTILHRVTRA